MSDTTALLRRELRRSLCCAAAACAAVSLPLGAQPSRPSPFDLSLEELGTVRVQTVSRRGEALNVAAAAVYVITAEDIRRSGVTSLPEALRLAPGVEVARNGAHEWTISIRGFSNDLSNKLLVLVNGRSVYSPLYAGVFWDAQDTLLADIDRIEIVAGPGGAVWGANAVNGVVNVITEPASDTVGTYAEAGAGSELETLVAFRHGWERRPGRYARAYVKYAERDDFEMLGGGPGIDAWDMLRGGVALEWEPADDIDRINVRIEGYDGSEDAIVRGDFMLGTLPEEFPGEVDISGYHALGSWRHTLGNDSDLRVQAYFDHTERDIPGSFAESRDTVSVSLQHDLADRGRHDLIWGADVRTTRDDLVNTTFAEFIPPSRSDDTLSAFVSDDISFLDGGIVLTLGSKLEENDYTGLETQPNARVAWLPSGRQTVWGSVSRAVRIPARLETDLDLLAPVPAGLPFPVYVNVRGNRGFESEQLTAYEAGYRLMPTDSLSFDFAVFDNYYDRLQTTEIDGFSLVGMPPEYALITGHIDNLMKGETYGGTVAASWQVRPNWRLLLHYARIELDLEMKPGGSDDSALDVAGNSPRHQYAARAYGEIGELSLYAGLRYVDELPSEGVPSYLALDLNAGWQISESVRASLTVMNANDRRHVEFGEGRAIERAALLKVVWQR